MNPVVVLGATGSVGQQTLVVSRHIGAPVAGIGARTGSKKLAELADALPEATVAIASPTVEEREDFARFGSRVAFGSDAIDELASTRGSTVVNGIVGAAGLSASVAALNAGNRLALANKESLVAAGGVLTATALAGGGEIIPVDSEHSALFQCMVGEDRQAVIRMLLTASGGPFLGRAPDELADVTPAEALAHPTWSMGNRITIDSATLMNKGFEVIEAHVLFGIPYDALEVVVHPQSIVHSLVEFVDGSLKAHVGEPDMRVPIQYALTYPDRAPSMLEPFRLAGLELTFETPDLQAFPALRIAYEAGRTGDGAPTVLNAADEVAVDAFLSGRLGFLGIAEVVERTLDTIQADEPADLNDVASLDLEARERAGEFLGRVC